MVSLLKKPALIINMVSTVTRTVTVRLPAVTSKEDVLLSVYQEKGMMTQYLVTVLKV